MSTVTMKAVSPPSKIGDFWGGFGAMLVALPSAIAFGVLVYSGIGQKYVGMGAMTGIIGSAVVAELVRENG